VVQCHMVSLLLSAARLVWSVIVPLVAVVGCERVASDAGRVVAPWEGALSYCVVDDDPLLYELVRDALDVWRVDADVRRGLPATAGEHCTLVGMVEGFGESRTDEGDYEVGRTQVSFAHGPTLVLFARWYWERCPSARWRLVVHEIGHSVGHLGHSSAGYAMAPTVDCTSAVDALPTQDELDLARETRTEGMRL
jgi:hypothetical protein